MAGGVPLTDELTIPGRFNGPSGSANGGYACGIVAAAIGPSARVDLRLPPPLDVPLVRERLDGGRVRLLHGDDVVAEGGPGVPEGDVPAAPSPQAAARAADGWRWRRPEDHPFPGCFVCGPLREEGDGLRLFAGPVEGAPEVLACPWRPAAELGRDGTVDPVFAWAALDCPSGSACIPPGTRTVLASMTARVDGAIKAQEPYVVTAWHLGSEGRKHRAGSAIHDAEGRLVACAQTLWITLRS